MPLQRILAYELKLNGNITRKRVAQDILLAESSPTSFIDGAFHLLEKYSSRLATEIEVIVSVRRDKGFFECTLVNFGVLLFYCLNIHIFTKCYHLFPSYCQ